MIHNHTIPDSYYIPDGQEVWLLSPQHWIQKTMSKQEWCQHSHSCITKHDHILLMWKDKYKWTAPLDSSNVKTFILAQGCSSICHRNTHNPQGRRWPSHTLNKRGGNMQVLSASYTTMSHCSSPIWSKSTSTCKDHHFLSSTSCMK